MGWIESGAKGDSTGSWAGLTCGTKDPITGGRSGVGGFWGIDGAAGAWTECYEVSPHWWIGATVPPTVCGNKNTAGERWGHCDDWRAWCTNNYWGPILAHIDKNVAVLEEKAAADVGALTTQVSNFMAVQGWIERACNQFVGGGTPGHDNYTAIEDSRVFSTQPDPSGSNAQYCRARVGADYSHAGCGGKSYPQKCKVPGEDHSYYPTSYWVEKVAEIRDKLGYLQYQFKENHPGAWEESEEAEETYEEAAPPPDDPQDQADAGVVDPTGPASDDPPEPEDEGENGNGITLQEAEFPTWAIGVGVGIVALAFLMKGRKKT